MRLTQRTVNASLGPLFASVPYAKRSDTSKDAADELSGRRVAILRSMVLGAFIAAGPRGLTADEAAERVGASVLACRPRATELFQAGLLEKTSERRPNASGMSARVLRRAT
jgi:hypothetical protein